MGTTWNSLSDLKDYYHWLSICAWSAGVITVVVSGLMLMITLRIRVLESAETVKTETAVADLKAIIELLVAIQTSNDSAENFERLIVPLRRDFEKVHTDYLATFLRYRESITNSKHVLDPSHPVFSQIETDSRFTASDRMRLLEPPAPENAGTLLELLREYVATGVNLLVSSDEPIASIPQLESWTPVDENFDRQSLHMALKALFASPTIDRRTKEERAVKLIDEIVEHLQAKYRIINRQFNSLAPTNVERDRR
jgi:hypothetical protein